MLFEDINILINKITILLENKNNYKSINFSEFNNIKYEICGLFGKAYNCGLCKRGIIIEYPKFIVYFEGH